MTRYTHLLFCFAIFLLTACRPSSSADTPLYIKLLAWNEDTIHSYQFAMMNDKKFAVKITHTDRSKREEYYHGVVISDSFDTIFLSYFNDRKPTGATNYLIKEISGAYLIQPFEDNPKRVFLRIQRFGLSRFR